MFVIVQMLAAKQHQRMALEQVSDFRIQMIRRRLTQVDVFHFDTE